MLKKFLLASFLMSSTAALAVTQIKLAVLVPEGTTWGNSLKTLSKEIAAATNNEVSFKIYFGGVSGDEPDVIRKIRIGQLHGGIFTGKTLGEIHSDVRAMEIPFTFFNNQAKATATLTKLTPQFNQGLKSKGYINLGFYEIGQVYVVSTKKIATLSDLQGLKMWSWEGDPLVEAMLESLKLISVPLALPDVLSSLSTGIINAAYAPPLAILALQWHSKIKYLVDFPTANSIGALLISDKVFSKLKPAHQQKIQELSRKIVAEANLKNASENEQARTQFKKAGIEFISFSKEDYKKATDARATVIAKIKDSYISAKMIETLDKEAK